MQKLISAGHAMLVSRDEVIFASGDVSDGAYILLEGEVCLALMNEDGTSLWARTLVPGAVFGLAAAIQGESQLMCAIAKEDSALCFVRRDALVESMRTDTALGNEVLRMMSLEVIDARRKLAMLGRR